MEGWTASSPHCLLAVMLFCGAAAGTQCPDGPLVIQAVQGSNATVEWCFSSNISISSLKILCEMLVPEWKLFYHLYDTVNMAEQPPDQQFAGRVHCDKDALRTGRVRLHLSRVQMNDSGRYRCRMLTGSSSKIKVFSLNITAAVDEPKPPTPQPEPELEPEPEPEAEPESWESLWLYVAVAAEVLLFFFCCLQFLKLHQEFQMSQQLQVLQKPKVNNMAPLLKQDFSLKPPLRSSSNYQKEELCEHR